MSGLGRKQSGLGRKRQKMGRNEQANAVPTLTVHRLDKTVTTGYIVVTLDSGVTFCERVTLRVHNQLQPVLNAAKSVGTLQGMIHRVKLKSPHNPFYATGRR